MKITNFHCFGEIKADAFGNNVAFSCPNCGHPVLAIIRDGQRGSKENPSHCKGCGNDYVVTADSKKETICVQKAN
jgi:predicted RNA-binding Zn-ribbon protein involved in translation (DUF1610 family)